MFGFVAGTAKFLYGGWRAVATVPATLYAWGKKDEIFNSVTGGAKEAAEKPLETMVDIKDGAVSTAGTISTKFDQATDTIVTLVDGAPEGRLQKISQIWKDKTLSVEAPKGTNSSNLAPTGAPHYEDGKFNAGDAFTAAMQGRWSNSVAEVSEMSGGQMGLTAAGAFGSVFGIKKFIDWFSSDNKDGPQKENTFFGDGLKMTAIVLASVVAWNMLKPEDNSKLNLGNKELDGAAPAPL